MCCGWRVILCGCRRGVGRKWYGGGRGRVILLGEGRSVSCDWRWHVYPCVRAVLVVVGMWG